MSERGSFVTEYVHCEKCLEALKGVLLSSRSKFLCAQQLSGWSDEEPFLLPIIAGKIGALAAGGELMEFELEIADQLEPLLCHDVAIAVLSEDRGSQDIIIIRPTQSAD